jgi:hypothetical protein
MRVDDERSAADLGDTVERRAAHGDEHDEWA